MHVGRTLLLAVPVAIGMALGFALHRSSGETPNSPEHASQPDDAAAESTQGSSTAAPAVELETRPPAAVPDVGDPIIGSVTSRDGEPLPGVAVELRPDPHQRWPQVGESLEKRLQWMIDDDSWRQARAITVESDEAGRYHSGHLATDAVYSVSARSPGWQFQREGGHRVPPGTEVNFVGSPVEGLRLDIRMPDGSAPPSVRVNLSAGGRNHTTQWSPEAPELPIRAGDYILHARVDPWYQADPTPVHIAADTSTEKLLIQLREPTGISVDLRGQHWMRRADVDVSVYCVALTAGLSVADLDLGTARRASRNNRRYQFLDLEPGSYAVILSFLFTRVTQEVTVSEGMTEVTLDVPGWPPPDIVVWIRHGGRLHHGSRHSLRVELMPMGGSRLNGIRSVVIPLDDGSWGAYLHRAVAPPEPGEEFWVKFSGEHLGMRVTRIDGLPAEIELDFEPTSLLEVHIENFEDYQDQYQIMARLRSTEWDTWNPRFRPGSARLFSLDRTGTIVCGGWEATDVTLVLEGSHRRGQYYYNDVLAVHRFRLRPGLHRESIRFEGLYEIVIVFPDGVAMNQIEIETELPDHNVHPMVHDERSVTYLLPPGRYRVVHRSAGRMGFEVHGDGEVQFHGVLPDRLSVQGTRPDGYLRRCGLQDGDEIVSFDGVVRTGRKPLREAIRRIIYGDAVTLGVIRAGAALDIALDPGLLETAGKAGGRLRVAYPPE